MRALLVANPSATCASARVRDQVFRCLGNALKLDVAETDERGHAIELARQAAIDGLDLVVTAGGDGTVNEVVNGLLADGPRPGLPALAVVPCGSANVFARALGLPRRAPAAIAELAQLVDAGVTRVIGLGRADARYFTFNAGLGLDAEVVRLVEERRAGGRKASAPLYMATAARHFFCSAQQRHAVPFVVEADDGERVRTADVVFSFICNTSPWTFAGRRPVDPCPEASFDCHLDLFGLRRHAAVPALRSLAQMFRSPGRPHGRDVVLLHDVPEFRVRTRTPDAPGLELQVDGDYVPAPARSPRNAVTFRSVPFALRVVAPPTARN